MLARRKTASREGSRPLPHLLTARSVGTCKSLMGRIVPYCCPSLRYLINPMPPLVLFPSTLVSVSPVSHLLVSCSFWCLACLLLVSCSSSGVLKLLLVCRQCRCVLRHLKGVGLGAQLHPSNTSRPHIANPTGIGHAFHTSDARRVAVGTARASEHAGAGAFA